MSLSNLIKEIFAGFSEVNVLERKAYLKHDIFYDISQENNKYDYYLDYYKKRGVASEKEREDLLYSSGVWSEKEDLEINKLKIQIEGASKVKKNLIYQSQIDKQNSIIKEFEDKCENLESQKRELIGRTRESLARAKSNEEYILNIFFKDKKFTEPLFSKDESLELEERDLFSLINVYNFAFDKFSPEQLKKASLENFFQSLIAFSENPFYFYGKPVSELTYFQLQIYALGRNYHHMLTQETEPPEDAKNDPDLLENWFQSYSNTRSLAEKSEGGDFSNKTVLGSGHFVGGATPEDLEKVGIKDGTSDFFSEMSQYTDESGQVNIAKIIASQDQK